MRKYLIFVIYVGVMVVLPFWYVEKNTVVDKFDSFLYDLGVYVFFISPLLFPIFFYLAKLKNLKEKLLFFLFGFVIPFCVIYYFLYLDYKENFHPGF